MTIPRTWKGVAKQFNQSTSDIQAYFDHLPSLLEKYPWDVSLAYVFTRIELVKHMTIYCGIVKLHRADADLVWKTLEGEHMSRKQFKVFFQTVFGKPIKATVLKRLEQAENVRDRVVHGKEPRDNEIRKAMVDIIDFAEQFNEFVESLAGFRPFGDLRGFKGRAQPLDKATTRWLLKGMGFTLA